VRISSHLRQTADACLDEQTLRKRIAELQEYRRMGITTGAEAEAYDIAKVARVSTVDGGPQVTPLTNPGWLSTCAPTRSYRLVRHGLHKRPPRYCWSFRFRQCQHAATRWARETCRTLWRRRRQGQSGANTTYARADWTQAA
jgi:hypothetical protein